MKTLLISLFSGLCLAASAQQAGNGILEYADSLQEFKAQVESGQEEVAPLSA